jgi:hypothetical protein
MTITVKVHVNGNFISTVKHIAGGREEVIDVGPNAERSFSFHDYVGDNVFIVGPDRPAVEEGGTPAHIVEQEAAKTEFHQSWPASEVKSEDKKTSTPPPSAPPDKKKK